MIFWAASALPSLRANDANDLIQGVEDQRKSIKDMNATLQRLQFVGQPLGDHRKPKVKEMPEHLLQTQAIRRPNFRVLGGDQAGQIDIEVVLQLRVLVEVRKYLVFVGASSSRPNRRGSHRLKGRAPPSPAAACR